MGRTLTNQDRESIMKKILEFALSRKEGLNAGQVSDELEVSYNVIQGMFTELLAAGYFRLEIVGAAHTRTFFPNREKIKEALSGKE